jgi:hypothetical protein
MDKMSGSDDKIHAGFNQFKKAFRDHWENGLKGEDPSHYLLRFYSVECGLKSMYIHKEDKFHKMNSKDMPPDLKHRLDWWLEELEISASDINPPPKFTLNSSININSPREIHRSHEAWRYGVKMDQTKEKLLLEWFDKAEKYIKDYLQEAI